MEGEILSCQGSSIVEKEFFYDRKIVFNYKKEVRIWKRISSMRRQLAKD